MKQSNGFFSHIKKAQALTPVLVVGLLMVVGAVIYNFNAHAATPGFYFQAASGAYKVGDTIDLAVFEDSGSQCANVVEADFSYPANLLQLGAVSLSDSKFDSSLPTNPGTGSVSLQQYTTRKECGSGGSATSGVSGPQLIAHVSFTVIGTGSAVLNFQNGSKAISSSDNTTNVASGTNGIGFTLSAGTTTPTPTPPPTPTPTPSPSPRPAPRPSLSVTPVNSGVSIPVTDNGQVQVQTPIDVTPLPVQPDGVNRVEYYLDGKLVATTKVAPYKYHLDTTKLLNGKHTLTSKTYYQNGQTKSVSQTIIVKNKFDATQFKLVAQKFAWLIILIILIAIAAIVAFVMHRRGGGPHDEHGNATYDYDTYVSSPIQSTETPEASHNDGPIIRPTNQQ